MAEIFDLLGDPVPDNFGGRGRPPHIPTQQNRNKVMLLLAMGWSDERIAKALAITQPTLRKHYFRELKVRDEARARVEGNLLAGLWDAAKAGNVAAAKEFRAAMDKADLLFADAGAKGEPPPTKAPKLGKKEIAAIEAANPDTEDEMGALIARRLDRTRQGMGGLLPH